MLGMLEGGVTHLGVATDHVIESFRNALCPGYKTSEGLDPPSAATVLALSERVPAVRALTRAGRAPSIRRGGEAA